MDDRALAGELATAAGHLLLDIRATSGLTGKDLGKEGDLRSNDLLMRRLAEERPDDAVLSEESADDKSRLARSACGSSTRSTVHANTAWTDTPIGRCMWRCGRPTVAAH